MPYPAPHFLTTFGGTLYTNEQWSCTLRSTNAFQSGDPAGAEALVPVAEAIRNWWTSQTIFGNRAQLNWVKHNQIGVNGKYTSASTNLWESPTPVNGGGTGTFYPPQIALAVTFETGVTRGLAARGRIFLPCPTSAVDAFGLINAGSATAAATSVATLLGTLNGLPSYGTASVLSDVREGASRPITGVSVGRVLDTMRSRRAQLSEERPPTVTVGGT